MTTEPIPQPSPGLKRGERRRWWLFAAAILMIGYLVGLVLSQSATNAKSDRAVRDDKTTIVRLTVVAAQASAAATQASAAATQAQHAVDCLNAVLGSRGPVTAADTDAEVDIFIRLQDVLLGKVADQPALYATFLTHLHADVKVLLNGKAFRDKTPLGKC